MESFARETGRRPDVFQLFTVWGSADWAVGRASMLHLSTSRGPGTREVITPAQIAAGRGDAFLVRFGERIAERGEPLYLRLMAEMNGPWNPYCAFDASGRARPGHSTRDFRRAWRRVALILRGGERARVDAKLRALGMPAVQAGDDDLARAPVALMWVPHNATALNTAANQPRRYWPGARYVDWVGTDFYGQLEPQLGRARAHLLAVRRQAVRLRRVGAVGARRPVVRQARLRLRPLAQARADARLQPGRSGRRPVPPAALPPGAPGAPGGAAVALRGYCAANASRWSSANVRSDVAGRPRTASTSAVGVDAAPER